LESICGKLPLNFRKNPSLNIRFPVRQHKLESVAHGYRFIHVDTYPTERLNYCIMVCRQMAAIPNRLIMHDPISYDPDTINCFPNVPTIPLAPTNIWEDLTYQTGLLWSPVFNVKWTIE
jgi:hypothetical protein